MQKRVLITVLVTLTVILMLSGCKTKETPITTNTADQYDPAVYGDKIVWDDNRSGNYDIYMTTI